jgi:hypothetical protein
MEIVKKAVVSITRTKHQVDYIKYNTGGTWSTSEKTKIHAQFPSMNIKGRNKVCEIPRQN